MSRQWRQKHIFLFIQIVQEMSRNFKSVAVCFSFFICKKKKLVVKIKTSRFFCKNFEVSGQFFLFLVSFYRPLTVVLIPGSLHLANYLFAKMIFLEYFLDFMNCFFDTSNERSYNARCNIWLVLCSPFSIWTQAVYTLSFILFEHHVVLLWTCHITNPWDLLFLNFLCQIRSSWCCHLSQIKRKVPN